MVLFIYFVYTIVKLLNSTKEVDEDPYYRLVASSPDKKWNLYVHENKKVILVYKNEECQLYRFYKGDINEFQVFVNKYIHVDTKLELNMVGSGAPLYRWRIDTDEYEEIPTFLDNISFQETFLIAMCTNEVVVSNDKDTLIPIIPKVLELPDAQ